MAASANGSSSSMKTFLPPSDPRSRKRPPRACTARTPSRLAPLAPSVERPAPRRHNPGDADHPLPMVLTSPPAPAQQKRWQLRGMWELSSIVNFLNVFRPVLNFGFDFSIDELESALITPNAALDDIHTALLKAIPPISRSPIGRNTWVTVLCKKLKDWWPWVAEGPFPLVPYHGEEFATYKELDPGTRVIILKALCEVRLDQDDLRTYIDDSLKQGVSLSTFRKDRIGVDMQGTTYWYENDPIAGQRLYRELRKTENKVKFKGRGRAVPPPAVCYWETLATNVEEFEAIAGKLSSSRNRLEVAVGKRINIDIMPELEELQKKKERALKKQQRQAVLLDCYLNGAGLAAGRPRRERKPVTYTFDDFDRSIDEAIKLIKKQQPSPEPMLKSDGKLVNGYMRDSEQRISESNFEGANLSEPDLSETALQLKQKEGSNSSESDFGPEEGSRRSRHHRRPERYSEREFVEVVSDNEADVYSDEEIEGEAVYDDDYLHKKKRRKHSSSSDGDEEYRGDEDGEDESEDDVDSMDFSDDGGYIQEQRRQRYSGRGRRKGGKVKSVDELQWGLRRSKRATKSNVDYSRYEDSDIEGDDYLDDLERPQRSNREAQVREVVSANSDENTGGSSDSEEGDDMPRPGDKNDRDVELDYETKDNMNRNSTFKPVNGLKPNPEAAAELGKKQRRFLDLNQAAPVGGGQEDSSTGGTRGVDGSANPYSQDDASGDEDGFVGDSGRALKNRPV